MMILFGDEFPRRKISGLPFARIIEIHRDDGDRRRIERSFIDSHPGDQFLSRFIVKRDESLFHLLPRSLTDKKNLSFFTHLVNGWDSSFGISLIPFILFNFLFYFLKCHICVPYLSV